MLEITRIFKVRMPELIGRPKSELTQINPDIVLKIKALIFFLLSCKNTRSFVMCMVVRKEESFTLLLDGPGVELTSYLFIYLFIYLRGASRK